MNDTQTSTVYGPVHSWREGLSLGVDPIRDASTCSFNCIYCQLGAIQNRTNQRQRFVPTETVLADFQRSAWRESRVICFSGSGEPTLALNLGEISRAIARIAPQPRITLTNGTLLGDLGVIDDMQSMDRVYVKMDALTEETYQRVNRPVEGITLEDVLGNVRAFRARYDGYLAFQVMLLPTNLAEIEGFADLLAGFSPDEVQLNTATRPYPRTWHVAARGGHSPEQRPYEATPMRALAPEEVLRVERILRESTGLRVRSAYSEPTT